MAVSSISDVKLCGIVSIVLEFGMVSENFSEGDG